MRALLLMGCAIGLGGCVTLNDLEASEPKMTLTTSSTPDEVEACMVRALYSDLNAPAVSRGPGYRLVDYNMGGTSFAAIHIYEQTPTRVEIRWAGKSLGGSRADKLAACAPRA